MLLAHTRGGTPLSIEFDVSALREDDLVEAVAYPNDPQRCFSVPVRAGDILMDAPAHGNEPPAREKRPAAPKRGRKSDFAI